MNSFRTFCCQTVISVVHIVLTLRVQLLGSFRLHVMPRHVFETKRNLGNETSETPVFPNVSFAACDFLVNAGCVMQKAV